MHPLSAATLIALIGGGILAFTEYSASEELRKEKISVQAELSRLEERLESLVAEESERLSLQKRRNPAGGGKDQPDGNKLQERVDTLRLETVRLEDEYATLRKEMTAAVTQARQVAAKSPPIDITLPGGRVLKECRIKDVDDGAVSVEHSAGLHRLALGETPAEWVEQFALAWIVNSPVKKDQEPSIAVAPAAPVAPVSPAAPSRDYEIRRKREALASWLQRYATAWRSAEYHSGEASRAAWNHYSARARGKISSHTVNVQAHSTKARQATAIADEALIQVHRLRADINDLQRQQTPERPF